MDICSHIGFPVNDVNSLHELPTYDLVGDFSVDELAYGVTTFLNIQDDTEEVSGSIPPEREFQSKIINIEAHENDDADLINSKIITHDGNAAKSINPHCSSAPSLPNPLKPFSAMKGSREKREATPPIKLTVKWAPDVYDPVPTSSVIINKPHKHSKKKSKSKQKAGSKSTTSRGSKGKDKKQVRKRSGPGSSSSHVNACDVSEIQIQPSGIDFHLGIPDLFCGVVLSIGTAQTCTSQQSQRQPSFLVTRS